MTGRITLALDDLVTGADPELRAVVDRVAALEDVLWPGLADQARAATADTTARLRAAAAAATGRVSHTATPASDVPGWVRLGALDAVVGWLLGRSSTCMHAPDAYRPMPVGAAAWKPGLVVCGECAHLLQLPRGSDADRRCDGCGRVTEGVEVGDWILPVGMQVGVMLYSVGVCSGCCWPGVRP